MCNIATEKKLAIKGESNSRLKEKILALEADFAKLESWNLEDTPSVNMNCSMSWIRALFSFVLSVIEAFPSICSFLFFLVFIFTDLHCDDTDDEVHCGLTI